MKCRDSKKKKHVAEEKQPRQASNLALFVNRKSGCNIVNREKLNYAKALKGSTRSLNSKALNDAKYGL